MKKLLFLTIGAFLALNSFGQNLFQHIEIKQGKVLDHNFSTAKKKVKNDTILPTFRCADPTPTFYVDDNDKILTGTYRLNDTTIITEVGQYLNESGDELEIYGIIALVVNKEEGPAKGSFNAAIYDTTNIINDTALAVSNSIDFDNINDTNSSSITNEFILPEPIRVNAPFWATINVDNGSDTISLASTLDGCGDVTAIFRTSQEQIGAYASSNLDIALHIWATVDTNVFGLDRNFVSRDGLKFYPNPAKDIATIEFDLPGENTFELVIQDVSGREVYRTAKSFNGEDREFELNVSNFKNGVYTYQVVGKKSQLNGVFVKE